MEYISLVSVLILILFIIFSDFLLRSLVVLNRFKHIPGPGPRLPIIGSLLAFYRPGVPLHRLFYDVITDLGERHKKDGLAMICFGSKVIVYLLKAEYAAEFLKDNNLLEKPTEYNFMKPWLGEGLVTANGQVWKNKRKLLNPTFHSNILNDYITPMNEECFKLTKKLLKASNNAFVDIRHLMSEVTFNIIAKTAMGLTMDQNFKDFEEFSECLERAMATVITRLYNPLNWYDFIYYRTKNGKQMKKDVQFMKRFTQNVINERRNNFKKQDHETNKQLVFLDLVLTLQFEDDSITDEDICGDVLTFLIAGHETSSNSLTWTLLLLGNYTECQKKLIQEMIEIFGDDRERDVNKDDLYKMQYTECVIKESLRLYPPASLFGRVTNTELEIGHYSIPKGATVMVSTLHVQRDEDVFSDPLKFFPERFEKQSNIQIGFMPFALGPRNCIGQRFAMMEMKIILAHIFRNFTILSLDTEKDIEITIDSVTKSINPIRIAFKAMK